MERGDMPIKIDGRALASNHEQRLRERLKSIKKGRTPTVVSFCNEEDPPSVQYTEMKQKKAGEVGVSFLAEPYSTSTPREKLAQSVVNYNSNPQIDGVMVQLPLPDELNIFKADLLGLIDPSKDVDGLTPEGRKIYLPATVRGVLSILDERIKDWRDRKVVVVGSEGEVGAPMVEAISQRGITVRRVDLKLGSDLNTDLLQAEIIISAVGSTIVRVEMIGVGVDLIDVGLGDFDRECFKKSRFYTPKLGGVGPMTVISLMENVTESFKRRMSS